MNHRLSAALSVILVTIHSSPAVAETPENPFTPGEVRGVANQIWDVAFSHYEMAKLLYEQHRGAQSSRRKSQRTKATSIDEETLQAIIDTRTRHAVSDYFSLGSLSYDHVYHILVPHLFWGEFNSGGYEFIDPEFSFNFCQAPPETRMEGARVLFEEWMKLKALRAYCRSGTRPAATHSRFVRRRDAPRDHVVWGRRTCPHPGYR